MVLTALLAFPPVLQTRMSLAYLNLCLDPLRNPVLRAWHPIGPLLLSHVSLPMRLSLLHLLLLRVLVHCPYACPLCHRPRKRIPRLRYRQYRHLVSSLFSPQFAIVIDDLCHQVPLGLILAVKSVLVHRSLLACLRSAKCQPRCPDVWLSARPVLLQPQASARPSALFPLPPYQASKRLGVLFPPLAECPQQVCLLLTSCCPILFMVSLSYSCIPASCSEWFYFNFCYGNGSQEF